MNAATPNTNDLVFWEVVARCLEAFHGLPRGDAEVLIKSFLSDIRKKQPAAERLVLHEEPFYVASELAQHALELDDYAKPYAEILASSPAPNSTRSEAADSET